METQATQATQATASPAQPSTEPKVKPKQSTLKQLLGGSPNMFQRVFSAMRAGYMFGGQRNIYSVYGYKRELTANDLYAKYERQDIAQRIVNAPVDELWAYPPTAMSDDDVFNTAWDALVDAYNPWPALAQADKLLAFGPFSAILMGLPGDPSTPARSNYKLENLVYLRSFGGDNIHVSTWDTDPQSVRFGMPKVYQFRTSDASVNLPVHYSRVIHAVDQPLQGNIQGIPRLNPVYNLLEDLLKVGGGSAETFWLTANRGMQVDVDKEMDLDEADANELSAELDEFQHNLRRYIRTRGVKITNLGSEVADPTGVFTTLMALLASATCIPQRILMGAEAGQLASAQDRANWAEFIERRRSIFAGPYLLTPFVNSLISTGILPKIAKPVEWEWPEAFHQNPLEKAQTQAQFARSVVNLSRQTQMQFPLVTLKECRHVLGVPDEVPTGDSLPEAYVAPAPAGFGGANPAAKSKPGGTKDQKPAPAKSGGKG